MNAIPEDPGYGEFPWNQTEAIRRPYPRPGRLSTNSELVDYVMSTVLPRSAPTLKGPTLLSTREDVMRQIELNQRAIDRALERLAKIESMPDEDAFFNPEDPEDVVIYFQKRFEPGGKLYSYAALRSEATDLWYTTGPNSDRTGYPWARFREFISTGVESIWLATEWEDQL